MSKILIGVAAGALWFTLSHVANAESVCRQVCDNGTCVSKCIERDNGPALHEHERGPGIRVPGVDIELGR